MKSMNNLKNFKNIKLSNTITNSNSNFIKLVPQLIKQSNYIAKELKNRIKLNNLFSELESKASNKFNFFIKESENRYRGSRSGTNLDALIKSSRKNCMNEVNKIIKDNFYSSNKDIINEREKMKKKQLIKCIKTSEIQFLK